MHSARQTAKSRKKASKDRRRRIYCYYIYIAVWQNAFSIIGQVRLRIKHKGLSHANAVKENRTDSKMHKR